MKKYDKEEHGFQIPHGFLEAVLFSYPERAGGFCEFFFPY